MDIHRYERVRDELDNYGVHADESIEEGTPLPATAAKIKGRPQSWDLRSVYFGTLLGFIFGFLTITSMMSQNSCTRKMSTWSPALQIYEDDNLITQPFNGALRESNKYRGPPSNELDAAWDEITYPKGGLTRLSKDELRRINASEYAAAYTEEMGGGYIAGIEVFHQLHCVNMLRQATYMSYYLPRNPEWKDHQTLRYHLDHCVDMLRQKLMCNADVGMITYVWVKGWKQAFPDFSTTHKCRDYSKVLDWAHENFVHEGSVADLVRAPEALERDTRP